MNNGGTLGKGKRARGKGSTLKIYGTELSAKVCCAELGAKICGAEVAATLDAEASPHKRRLKCVTNISPRRLMTHLLHQMVHYRTTLCGSEQRSATITRITIHTHATLSLIHI